MTQTKNDKMTAGDWFCLLAILGVILFFIIAFAVGGRQAYLKSQDEAEWRGRCEALHAKVYQMDDDHRVCLRNGKVVNP